MKNYVNQSKHLLIVLFFILIKLSLSAQSSVSIDATQLYTSFSFTDSLGNKLNDEYSGIYAGAYKIGYNYLLDFGLFFNGHVGMRKAGATMEYDEVNYTWNLQYVESKLGVGYIYGENRFKPYLSANGYFAYLLKANQTINKENFDILETGDISNSDFGISITPGLSVEVSEMISVYTEFNYMLGLKNLEDSGNGQKAYNLAYGLSLGLSFSLEGKAIKLDESEE